MSKAFEISARSLDPRTKHGCVIIDENNKPISEGYNSPPPGCIDENIPLESPEKYKYFTHAEVNAILNANNNRVIEGATFYITGYPCSSCFRAIRTVRAKRIIYGAVNSFMLTEDQYEKKAVFIMNQNHSIECDKHIEIIRFSDLVANGDDNASLDILIKHKENVISYINSIRNRINGV